MKRTVWVAMGVVLCAAAVANADDVVVSQDGKHVYVKDSHDTVSADLGQPVTSDENMSATDVNDAMGTGSAAAVTNRVSIGPAAGGISVEKTTSGDTTTKRVHMGPTAGGIHVEKRVTGPAAADTSRDIIRTPQVDNLDQLGNINVQTQGPNGPERVQVNRAADGSLSVRTSRPSGTEQVNVGTSADGGLSVNTSGEDTSTGPSSVPQ